MTAQLVKVRRFQKMSADHSPTKLFNSVGYRGVSHGNLSPTDLHEKGNAPVGENDSRVKFLNNAWKRTAAVPAHESASAQLSPPNETKQATVWPQAPSKQRVNLIEVPTEDELGIMFDEMDPLSTGFLGTSGIKQCIDRLNNNYNFSFAASDVDRLTLLLLGGNEPGTHMQVSRAQFVAGIRTLGRVFSSLTERGFTLTHVKAVLQAAFDQFDTNGDGEISAEEFSVATHQVGLSLTQSENEVMYSFLVGNQGARGLHKDKIEHKPDFLQQWGNAVSKVAKKMSKTKVIKSMMRSACHIGDAFNEPGDIFQKAQKAMHTACGEVEHIAEGLELAGETAGMGVAIHHIGQEVDQAIQAQSLQSLDISELAPFLLCVGIGLLKSAETFKAGMSQDMTKDEAVLYAKTFQQYGFSQAEFKKIMNVPSCAWGTAKTGEVISTTNDTKFKIILKGKVQVCGTDAKLFAGSSMGESELLDQRRVWGDRDIKATESLEYISWEIDSLKKLLNLKSKVSDFTTRLVVDTMTANLKIHMQASINNQGVPEHTSKSALSEAELCLNESEQTIEGLFRNYSDGAMVSANEARGILLTAGHIMNLEFKVSDCQLFLGVIEEVVSVAKMKQMVTNLEKCKKLLTNIKGDHLVPILCKGHLSKHDVKKLMPHINARMGVTNPRKHGERMMMGFVGVADNGVIGINDFCSKFGKLAACIDACKAVFSFEQLLVVLHEAFQHIDTDGDCRISCEELVEIMQKIDLPLDKCMISTIHDYLDMEKDGLIRSSSLQDFSWTSALCETVNSHTTQKDVAQLRFFMANMKNILAGEGNMQHRAEKALATMLEASGSFVGTVTCATDVCSNIEALGETWRQISGVTSLEDLSRLDLASLTTFLGISALDMLHNVTASQERNMTYSEALLYAKAFKPAGFTVPEFKKIMKHCKPAWQSFSKGAIIGPCNTRQLKIIVQGLACQCSESMMAQYNPGDVIGCEQFLDVGAPVHEQSVLVASKPTTMVSWDISEVNSYLEHNACLKNKVQRMVTSALAEKLLHRRTDKGN